jgi:cobalt transporter subunit CbtB
VTEKEIIMTTQTQTRSTTRIDTSLAGIALTAFVGATLVLLAGFAQASSLHNAAHDPRHAIAFPCH